MEIIVARIITGEIVVGKKTDMGIGECIALRVVQKSQTEIESHLMPLLHPFSDKFIDIDIDKIVFSAPANNDLINQYSRITSPISIVPSMDLSKLSNNVTPFNPRRK